MESKITMQLITPSPKYPYLAIHKGENQVLLASGINYTEVDLSKICLLTKVTVPESDEVVVSSPLGLWRHLVGNKNDYIPLPEGFTLTITQKF